MDRSLMLRALARLKGAQQVDGSFASISSTSLTRSTRPISYTTTFVSSQILACLHMLQDHAEAKEIQSHVADFLLSQKSTHWTWNYWRRGSHESSDTPYPDDADDTFCSLSALWMFNPALIPGAAIAETITLLQQLEVSEGGPYRTWYVSASADNVWRDVDLVVNSNIAHFLSLHDVRLPSLQKLTDHRIETSALQSQYYPSIYPVIYFIARWYKGSKRAVLKNMLMGLQHKGHWGTPLDTALSISALIRLGADRRYVAGAIEYLLQCESEEKWTASAFCIDPTRNSFPYYCGADSLTTAFCLEAVALSDTLAQAKTRTVPFVKEYDEVISIVRQRFALLDPALVDASQIMTHRVLQNDTDRQIVLLPYLFYQALGNITSPISAVTLKHLSLATVYGWIAYTIYDDYIDEEGDSTFLGVANICLREVTESFRIAFSDAPLWMQLVHECIDDMDSANSWELRVCRKNNVTFTSNLPSEEEIIQRLPDKSIGHALSIFGILLHQGHSQSSREFQEVKGLMRHYLTARQLLDDAHDWQEDYKRGILTAATRPLFIASQIGDMRTQYWDVVIPTLCQRITEELEKARLNLAESVIKKPDFFLSLLDGLGEIVHTTLRERQHMQEFIKRYSEGPHI